VYDIFSSHTKLIYFLKGDEAKSFAPRSLRIRCM